jgi:D-alanine-D-alanine ligase
VFDYEAKYMPGLTEYIVPAQLSAEARDLVQRQALLAYTLLGCRGCARVDIMLDKSGVPFVLEVNTIPGMTKTSLLPKAAGCAGISFTDLCLGILESAYEK